MYHWLKRIKALSFLHYQCYIWWKLYFPYCSPKRNLSPHQSHKIFGPQMGHFLLFQLVFPRKESSPSLCLVSLYMWYFVWQKGPDIDLTRSRSHGVQMENLTVSHILLCRLRWKVTCIYPLLQRTNIINEYCNHCNNISHDYGHLWSTQVHEEYYKNCLAWVENT